MIVNLNFDMILQLAAQKAQQMVSNGLYSRFNLSIEGRIEKATLGCIGELAFEEYLKQKNIIYQTDQSDFSETNTDEFDFLIGGKKIDVKVAKKSTRNPPTDGWTYGYPQEQNPSTKDYVIVGWVDFYNKQIGFYGWITGEAVSKFKVVTQNSFKGYKYLTPNHEFPWGTMNKDIENLIKGLK